MQCEVFSLCKRCASQNSLELRSFFKPLHANPDVWWRQVEPWTWTQKPVQNRLTTEMYRLWQPGLNGEALAAFCTTCSNDSAAATRFHAGQKTVCTCALDFRGLVCAFHDLSSYLYNKLSIYWFANLLTKFATFNYPMIATNLAINCIPTSAANQGSPLLSQISWSW